MEAALVTLEKICMHCLSRPSGQKQTFTITAVFPLFARVRELEQENAHLRAALAKARPAAVDADDDPPACPCAQCASQDEPARQSA